MGLGDAVLVSGSEASDAVLTSHPASKYVLDLLRIVTVDSLSLAPSKTAPPLVDILLEVSYLVDKSALARENWGMGTEKRGSDKRILEPVRQILLFPQDNLSPILCHAPVSRA